MADAATTKDKAKSDRTTVGLSPTAIKHVDAIVERNARLIRQHGGIPTRPSRSDVVEAVLTEAATRREGESA